GGCLAASGVRRSGAAGADCQPSTIHSETSSEPVRTPPSDRAGTIGRMAPDHSLDLERQRDLLGRSREPWARRGVVAALCLIPVLALGNVFGQQADVQRAETAAASLAVESPVTVRGGLIFQSRF